MKYNEKYVMIPQEKYDRLIKQQEQCNVNADEAHMTSHKSPVDIAMDYEVVALSLVPADRQSHAKALMNMLPLTQLENGNIEVSDTYVMTPDQLKHFVAFTQSSSVSEPIATRYMYAVLLDSDIPHSLIGNRKLVNFMQSVSNTDTDDNDDDDDISSKIKHLDDDILSKIKHSEYDSEVQDLHKTISFSKADNEVNVPTSSKLYENHGDNSTIPSAAPSVSSSENGFYKEVKVTPKKRSWMCL